MPSDTLSFLDLAEETLRFAIYGGDVTHVRYPHVAGWRQLPELMTAHTAYSSVLRVDGRPDRRVRNGDTICICSNVRHQIEVDRGTDGPSRWSHVTFTILGSVDIFTLIEPPSIIGKPLAIAIGDLNQGLAELGWARPSSLDVVVKRKALGFRLLELVASCSKPREGSKAFLEGAQRLAPVLHHIDENLSGELSREELASLVHLSPSRFHAVFSRTLGVAPRDYVWQQRFKRAQQLLIRSDLSVKEIAAQIGQDPFHFSRSFKRASGASPQHYRIQVRKGLA